MAKTGKKTQASNEVWIPGTNNVNTTNNTADSAAKVQGKTAKPGSVEGHQDPTEDDVAERWSD